MKRPSPLRLGLIGLASILAGCDYSAKRTPALPHEIVAGPLPTAPGHARPEEVVVSPKSEAPVKVVDTERRRLILENVINLMRTASTNPGGQNFAMATENLNDLFEQGTEPSDYFLSKAAQDFLLPRIYELTNGQDPTPVVKSFCTPKFTIRDARHIEDCMLYHVVARRVAGEGDDLTKVRRLFDWTARNILLVPPESLSGEGLRQAQARPADVLLRGMATEYGGTWSERGWLFMALCRQIGIDAGILTFTPRQSAMVRSAGAARPQIPWICAAIVDNKPYLFDQRIGLEIPSPDGKGVATLEDAINDPDVLGRLDVPGLSAYGTSASDLAGSTTRIGILIDSSTGYFSPRMRLLQGQLRGEYRTILFRDPAEQASNFARALGKRLGPIRLWELPISVEESLFKDSAFVQSTLLTLRFFDSKYPLLYGRTAQLRGETADAIDKYVSLRFAENAVKKDRDKTPIAPEEQKTLDVYATYFLGQCHLDRGNTKQAEDLFRQLLALSPEPGPGRYYYYMLRWGAMTNLGRICESKGDRAGAIAFYSQDIKTPQRHGNLIRARDLVWSRPFDEPLPPLPPAPPDIPLSIKAVGR